MARSTRRPKPAVQAVEVRGRAFRVRREGVWGHWHLVASAEAADAIASQLAGATT